MARLIHLNGPPGIGKSTLAERYAADHPGILSLDVDRLRPMIGGWRGRFAETGATIRPLALSMARTHLDADSDVVLPQFLGRLREIERFEQVARDADSAFLEVILMDARERAVDRFYSRRPTGSLDGDALSDEINRVVESDGGRRALEGMYDQLAKLIPDRADALVIDSPHGDVDATYDRLLTVVGS